MREITGIEEVKDSPPPPSYPWFFRVGSSLALIVCLTLILAGFLFYWMWTRHLSALSLPPDRWVLAELDRIEALGLPEAGETKQYHVLLSNVLRRYLELRFHRHASRQTTAEFLQQLPPLTPEQEALLRDFLHHCDLAKFAQITLSLEECKATASLARRFVEETSAVKSVGEWEASARRGA